jgi:hypothetical protein
MARIEVARFASETTKQKGDLLEAFAERFLTTQNYRVTKQVRVTASELDLLCENAVNGKMIYVECKAHREALGAPIFRNLLGTVSYNDYSEGWLISTGDFGKDAKGFVEGWRKKLARERERLSFFPPEVLIESFVKSGLVSRPETISGRALPIATEALGAWTLLISTLGDYWCRECLVGGIPKGVLVFRASSGELVQEVDLLSNLAKTDTTLADLDFNYINTISGPDAARASEDAGSVVPVQHGESWDDYRPARPQDFVGRTDSQRRILDFLLSVLADRTDTRVFAITGNSGMGKSSLIAKLRDRCRNVRYRRKLFLYAVDVRAAKNNSYIYQSIIRCIQEAMKQGFISSRPVEISDHLKPFDSPALRGVTDELRVNRQLLCLVFDQFEELYSKPELLSVFDRVKDLFLDVTSMGENFCLGFAWKSDSTVYQDHPAYHFWHSLSDQRYSVELVPFTKGDSERVLSIFEHQVGQKLPKDVRHKLITQSQGYPWLLKKLCIHLFQKLVSEKVPLGSLISENLDIKVLFDRDLQELSASQNSCLRLVAEKAPVDWYQVTDISGPEVLRSLTERRLVTRSGDRLTIYWDIFREYILTHQVPALPFNYLPMSPSLGSFMGAAACLRRETSVSFVEIAARIGVSEATAQNIAGDLMMLNVATGSGDTLWLASGLADSEAMTVLTRLRSVFQSHIVVQQLRKLKEGTIVRQKDVIAILKERNPTAQHSIKTWRLYSNRIIRWLTTLCFLVTQQDYWLYQEQELTETDLRLTRRILAGSGTGFTLFCTPPRQVLATAELLHAGPKAEGELRTPGAKNAVVILKRLHLVSKKGQQLVLQLHEQENPEEAVRSAAREEPVFEAVAAIVRDNPGISGPHLAAVIDSTREMGWSPATKKRVGYALRIWHDWLFSSGKPAELF